MKIGVIGLGLIGGSIFKALIASGKYNVIGISRTVCDEKVSNDYKSLDDCDLIFVCTPMSVTLEVLDKLQEYVSPETIVTDVCSLKRFVSKKKYSYKFIPSHPMAGTENNGWEASFAELFQGAKWVITPLNGDVIPEQEILESVIKDLGAEVVITSPEEHDKAVALISHMPMVVAQALCMSIKDNQLAQVLASTGFKDTTRLALSNTQMAEDMVNLNAVNIVEALETLNDSVFKLIDEDYREQIEDIKTFRKNLYS